MGEERKKKHLRTQLVLLCAGSFIARDGSDVPVLPTLLALFFEGLHTQAITVDLPKNLQVKLIVCMSFIRHTELQI